MAVRHERRSSRWQGSRRRGGPQPSSCLHGSELLLDTVPSLIGLLNCPRGNEPVFTRLQLVATLLNCLRGSELELEGDGDVRILLNCLRGSEHLACRASMPPDLLNCLRGSEPTEPGRPRCIALLNCLRGSERSRRRC